MFSYPSASLPINLRHDVFVWTSMTQNASQAVAIVLRSESSCKQHVVPWLIINIINTIQTQSIFTNERSMILPVRRTETTMKVHIVRDVSVSNLWGDCLHWLQVLQFIRLWQGNSDTTSSSVGVLTHFLIMCVCWHISWACVFATSFQTAELCEVIC